MPRSSSLSAPDLERYFALIRQAVGIRRHFDLLVWLQGDVQHFLPHEIMLSAWGDFRLGLIAHDIVSVLPGVRTERASVESVSPLLSALFSRWIELGRSPYIVRVGENGFDLSAGHFDGALGEALKSVRSALIHGICDERGRHDCLYVMFCSTDAQDQRCRGAMEILLPHLDTALRQVPTLAAAERVAGAEAGAETHAAGTLTERELEIMTWVKMGKTNQEIGMILDISSFTVKNHLKRIFKKLAVYNRMQAVSRFEALGVHGAN